MSLAVAPAKPAPKSEPKAQPAPAKAAAPAAATHAPPQAGAATTLPAYARPAAQPAGVPLDSTHRQRFEASFRRDLSSVRVHFGAGDKVEQLAPGAQAVTVGADVYLKQATPNADYGELLAHELTHVVQQQEARGATATAGTTGERAHDPREHEARRNVVEFRQNRPLAVAERSTTQQPQAEEEQNHGWFYNRVVSAVPALRPILDRGLYNWISDRVSDVAASVMDTIRGPLDTIRGIETTVSSHVVRLIDWIRRCIAALMRGDCSVLHEGIEYVEHVIDGLTAPAFEALKAAFEKVSTFLNGLWERYGAPLWTKVKDFAGRVWAEIERFFGWIREKIQPIIDWAIGAWTRVKTWLGIGDDPDSANGLLPWAQRKLEALWERVKARIEPIKRPLLVVAGILVMLSPAGPFIAIGAAIGGVIEAVRWIRRTFSMPGGVVSMRDMLQRVILPRLISGITGIATFLADKARFVLSKLLGIKQGLDQAAAAIGDTIVGFLAGPIQFISGLFGSLVAWANERLTEFVQLVSQTATRMAAFLGTILDALEEIAHVVRDIMRIVGLLMGRVWNRIPACIRDPFIDFLGLQILGRIPIFQAIAGTPEAWAQTKDEVKGIIHAIFFDFDLIGAMKKTFRLMLRVLNVPIELLTAVLEKMGAAWDAIKAKPVDFLKNLFKTVALALRGFFRNILTHLGHGIVGWITSQLQGSNVQLPSDWTDLGQIFSFVASVLGLSINHVCELLERRGLNTIANVVRTGARLAGEAWEWITLVIRGDFAAFWQRVREKITNLKETIINGVIDWIMTEVVGAIMMQLVTTADPTGISEAIMLLIDIYRTIKTVVQYMRQVLEMVQKMLDGILGIAAGVLQPAADLIEQAMDWGMPVVIGFLANLAGIGNIGQQIKDVIKTIRGKVDDAILWLIDLAKSAIQAVAGAVGAVRNWWRERFSTKIGDESHTVVAHGQGSAAEIWVESTPKRLADLLTELDSHPDANKTVLQTIRTRLSEVETLRARPESRENDAEIADKMQTIADLLKTVVPGGEAPESTIVTHETQAVANCTVGKHVKVAPLTYKPPRNAYWRGSEPGYGNTFFRDVNRRVYTYVQGHLLNHHLYGPGEDRNLVPIHRSLNTQMSSSCEEPVKAAVLVRKKVVSYDIDVTFGTWTPQYTHIPAENLLPRGITLRAHEMRKKSGAKGDLPEHWEDGGAEIYSATLLNDRGPDEAPGGPRHLKRVNLNARTPDAARAFEEVYGIGPVKAHTLLGKGQFTRLQDVVKELGLPTGTETRWQDRSSHPEVALAGDIEWE